MGVKDPKWSERPLALVVPKPGAACTPQDISAHVMAAVQEGLISKFGVPDQVLFVEQLARTSVGKLNKRALRQQYGG